VAYEEALAERARAALAPVRYIGPEGLKTDRSLQGWVDRGVEFASSLPPKRPKSKKHASPKL
jgi:hypothetical protein